MTDTGDRLDAMRNKYKAVFEALEREQVALGLVRYENGKLSIHGESDKPGVRDRIWEIVKRTDASANEVLLDIATPDDQDQVNKTGQTQVNTAGSFSHGAPPNRPEREP